VEKRDYISELKATIHLKEIQLEADKIVLREQLQLTMNSLKPMNLIKSTFKTAVNSPDLMDGVINTALGLATGYLSKTIFVGASSNMVRKVLGSAVQLGVTSLVGQNITSIKSFGHHLLNKFLPKKKINTDQL
jgi:hypothetical protein